MDKEQNQSLFNRLREGLQKSRRHISGQVDALVAEHPVINENFFEELTDVLILSDMGVPSVTQAINTLRAQVKAGRIKDADSAKEMLSDILVKMLDVDKPPLRWPMVILTVGVNGVGKTTTIGKLALRFQALGRTILLCAADTFRAAAADQLTVWAERAKCPIVKHREGADPAGVVFDAVQAAKARKADLLIIDTAGRLHNKKNLMDEMEKIRRVIDREYPEASMRCLLVVDATTGQNGLVQARVFREVAGANGIVLTKMDGTAKGGIAFSILQELQVPVMYIGVGEGIEDLQAFDAKEFVRALFE